MTQTVVTLTFPTAEAAVEFLASRNASAPRPESQPVKAPAPAPKAEKPVATKPTAEAAPVAAPSPKAAEPEVSPASADEAVEPTQQLDFKKDIVDGALMPYSKRVDRETFAALMKKLGVSRVPELEAKPELWPEIIKHCAA